MFTRWKHPLTKLLVTSVCAYMKVLSSTTFEAVLVCKVRRSFAARGCIMCRWRGGSSWINQHPENVFGFNPSTSFLMPSPLSSPSKVNKPSSEAQRMAVGLPNRRAESSFYLRAAALRSFYIWCGGRERRARGHRPRGRIKPSLWGRGPREHSFISASKARSAGRGVRRSLPLFQKEDYFKKRPICWARTFPVSNPPFNSRPAMVPLSTCTLWAALGLWDANVPVRRTGTALCCQTPDNRDWRVTRARITAGQSIECAPYICDDVAADIENWATCNVFFNAFY